MPDGLHRILEFLPFISLTTGDRRYHVNTADLTKTIIMSVVTGLLTAYITVQKLEVRMDAVEKKLDKIQSDFYRPAVEK